MGIKIAADAYGLCNYHRLHHLGNVFCFDKTGKLKFKLESVGMNPNKVIF